MSLSSVELWQRISSAGLAAPMICRSWAAEALQGLQPTDATDANKILDQLVRLGRLTVYQADLIAGKRQGEFKKGAWTLLGPVSVPLWEGWFEAVRSPNESPSWLRWVSSDGLAALRNAAPSLPRGLRLAQLRGPHLQNVQIPELIDKQLQLQVQPLQGIPLMMALQKEPGLGLKSAQIVRLIAEALKPMHAAGLAHGRVLPDRVFWNADAGDGVTLARDPICCHTASLDTRAIGVIQNGLNGLSPAQFMAPEFLAPGQLPTPSSDIYSLGCLWWWLVTGKPLVVGSTLDKQLARQAEASIALPKECTLPPPFMRCLQHCLAKNLPARFATAEQLCHALDAAKAAVDRGPVAKKRIDLQPVAKPEIPAPIPAKTQKQTDAPKLERKPDAAVPQMETAKSQPKVTESSAAPNLPPKIQPQASQPTSQPLAPAIAKNNDNQRSEPVALGSKQDKSKVQVESTQPTAPKPRDRDVPELIASKPTNRLAKPEETRAKQDEANKREPQLSDASKSVETKPAETKPAVVTQTAVTPAVAKPGVSKPTATKPVVSKTAATKPAVRKKVKRKPTNQWALPVVGGLGAVCVLLGVLIVSGVMKPSGRKTPAKTVEVANGSSNNGVEGDSQVNVVSEPPKDPRLEVYRIVPSGKDLLWAPPSVPKPIALDLLPPGGQIFVTLQPKQLMVSSIGKSILAGFNEELGPYLEQIGKRAGVPFDSIERVTVAVYAENEVPLTCMRVVLAKPIALSVLKGGWGAQANEKTDMITLLSNAAGESYFVAQQPLSDAQSVSEFSFGPTALMKEAAELQGAAGPLVSQLGKLWQVSDADADFSLLLTSSFLFSEGKSILASMPKRLASRLRELLEVDSRAALVQMRFEPAWYVETQLIGLSEREAPRLSDAMRQRISGVSSAIEDWFVSEQPHPYWRPLAIRYPQMLRALAEQTRFGVEGGAAVANAYLPPEAASNILLSTWIASQEGATLASDAPAEVVAASPTAKPLTTEEYLARKIKLSFDQEPIETALRLVGEEANANLPTGTPQLRFALDGGAFERAGITRNQQLRDFKHVDLPMRDALTAIAKRGNPVTTVKDTHEEDQRLIWVLRDDPENAGKQMISLTTRAEATAKSIPLPTEFAPVK